MRALRYERYDMTQDIRVTLAKIAGPHGIKGLVKIYPLGEDIGLLEQLSVNAGETPVKITLKNQLGKFILAEIDIIKTREDAEKMSGVELSVERDALPEIEDDGQFYHHELVGLKAVNTEGEVIGEICAVENFGAGDLLEIRPLHGEKYLIPFTDDFVPDVDIDLGHVVIIPMEMM